MNFWRPESSSSVLLSKASWSTFYLPYLGTNQDLLPIPLAPWFVIFYHQRSLVLTPSSPTAMILSWSLLQKVDFRAAHPFYHLGNFFWALFICPLFGVSCPDTVRSFVYYSHVVHPSITWGVLAPISLEYLVHSSHTVHPLLLGEFLDPILLESFVYNSYTVYPLLLGEFPTPTLF